MKQTIDRKHGYLEALRERGITIRKRLVKCGQISFNSGLSDTLTLLDQPEIPGAILADNGLLSIAAFQAIRSRGLRIPEDIAIIGFMSDWVSGMTYPRMTFIKQNLKDQLTHPVRWTQSVENMVADGADQFTEFGPGEVLTGLIKRIVPDL